MFEGLDDTLVMAAVRDEIAKYLSDVSNDLDGEHLYSNYQKVTAYCVRLQEIHNELSIMEIEGTISPQLKKLRTMVLDPTIERLEKVAAFESRKITARQIEANLER